MLKKYRASILGSAIASALFTTCTIPAFAANIIVDSHQTVPGDFPSSWTIALGDQLLIGHSANGELTISSGANVYTPSPIQIGGAINGPSYGTGVVGTGTGTLNVQGVGTILTSKGDFTVGKTATGSLTVTDKASLIASKLYVGFDGNGEALISNGATAQIGIFDIGGVQGWYNTTYRHGTGEGKATITGIGTDVDVSTYITVGNNAKGYLEVLDGAKVAINTGTGTFGGILTISNPGKSGTVVVDGAGSQLTSTQGILMNGDAAATADSWATLKVSNSGYVHTDDMLKSTISSNSRARIDVVSGGNLDVAKNVYIGANNSSVQTENVINIDGGGSFTAKSAFIAARNDSAKLDVNISNGGKLLVGSNAGHWAAFNEGVNSVTNFNMSTNGVFEAPEVYLGFRGTTNLNIMSGSQFIISGLTYISDDAASLTNILVSGASSLYSTDSAYVAFDGTANIYVADSGTFQSTNGIHLAYGSGAAATLNVGTGGKAGTVDTPTIIGYAGGDAQVNFRHSDEAAFAPVMSGALGVNVENIASGNTIFTAQNTYTGDTHVKTGKLSAGAANAFSANSAVSVDTGGVLNLNNYDQSVASLTHKGLLTFGNTPGTTMEVTGDYVGDGGTIAFNTVLAYDDAATDRLVVLGNTSGTTNVTVANAGGTGAQTLDGIKIVEVQGASNGVFVKAAGQRIVAGAYEYDLARGTDASANSQSSNWYLTSTCVNGVGDCENPGGGTEPGDPDPKPGGNDDKEHIYRPEGGAYIDNIATANQAFVHTLHDRLGEPQYTDAVKGQIEHPTSMWLRTVGGHNRSHSSDSQAKTQSNRFVIQGGGDIASWSSSGEDRTHIGLMFGYVNGKGNTQSRLTDYKAKSQTNGYSAGVYGTWYQNDAEKTGLYVDSWAQYNWFKHSINGDNISGEKYKSRGEVLSLESGYTFLLKDNKARQEKLFLQPQAQVVWMNVKAKDHRETNGTRVSSYGDGNLMTRLGARLYLQGQHEQDRGKDRVFQPFIEANWLHNSKNFGAKMNGVRVDQEGSRNLGELKLGVEGQINKRLNLWGNVSEKLGKSGYSDTSALIGIKYMF